MSLAQRLLAELRRGPVRTPDLVTRCAGNKRSGRSQVWVVLQMLERNGLVKRQLVKVPLKAKQRIAAWSLA